MKMFWGVLAFACAAMVFMVPADANADVVDDAIEFTSPSSDFTNGQWSLGWEFSTKSNITVTALGFYDDQKNGLTENHDVGIFDAGRTLLTSTIVTNADRLEGWFRYHSIAPLTLTAGQSYFIAATTIDEIYTWNPTDFTVNPLINFLGDAYQKSTTLVFPGSGPIGKNGFFGPDFEFAATAVVPEPCSFALLSVGGVGLSLKIYRRRRERVS